MLSGHKLLINYINSTIFFCNFNVHRPMKHKTGNIFLEWTENEILFTLEELTRLHLHFMHTSASRLYQLIPRADPRKATPSIRKLNEDVSAACDSCKSYNASPLRFRTPIPSDQVIFNQVISTDLLWLHDRPVLQVIDDQTGYRSAVFLK